MRKVENAISLKTGHKKPLLSKVEVHIPEVEISVFVYVFGDFRKSKSQSWKSKLQVVYRFLKVSEVEVSILEVEIAMCAWFLKVCGGRNLNPGSRNCIFWFCFWRFSKVEISILVCAVRKQTIQKWNKLSSRLRDISHLESTY